MTATMSEVPSLLQSGVVAALVAGAVSLAALWATARRVRQERQRQLFADAFDACIAYKEFAYVVRRRADDSAVERTRISLELSEVQKRIASYDARLRVEAPRVSAAYSKLVEVTRRISGHLIKEGWEAPPVPVSETGNIVGLDFSGLIPSEDRYLQSVGAHLSLIPASARLALRRSPRLGP